MGIGLILKLISNIYIEKIRNDLIDVQSAHERQPLLEFIYNYYLCIYGLRDLAESHILDLVTSVRKHHSHKRVRMFGKFLGFFGDEISETELDKYLLGFALIGHSHVGPSLASVGANKVTPVAMSRASDVFSKVFPSLDSSSLADCLDEMQRAAFEMEIQTIGFSRNNNSGNRSSIRAVTKPVQAIDLDDFLEVVVKLDASLESNEKKQWEHLFVEVTGSILATMTLPQFRNAWKRVDPTSDRFSSTRYFSHALHKSSHPGQLIGVNAFVDAANQFTCPAQKKLDQIQKSMLKYSSGEELHVDDSAFTQLLEDDLIREVRGELHEPDNSGDESEVEDASEPLTALFEKASSVSRWGVLRGRLLALLMVNNMKSNPLDAFDEYSKLMSTKMTDEGSLEALPEEEQ